MPHPSPHLTSATTKHHQANASTLLPLHLHPFLHSSQIPFPQSQTNHLISLNCALFSHAQRHKHRYKDLEFSISRSKEIQEDEYIQPLPLPNFPFNPLFRIFRVFPSRQHGTKIPTVSTKRPEKHQPISTQRFLTYHIHYTNYFFSIRSTQCKYNSKPNTNYSTQSKPIPNQGMKASAFLFFPFPNRSHIHNPTQSKAPNIQKESEAKSAHPKY